MGVPYSGHFDFRFQLSKKVIGGPNYMKIIEIYFQCTVTVINSLIFSILFTVKYLTMSAYVVSSLAKKINQYGCLRGN